MSGELPKPQCSSTPRKRDQRLSSATNSICGSEADRLGELTYDYADIRLLSEATDHGSRGSKVGVSSRCLSVLTRSDSDRPLFSLSKFDDTIISHPSDCQCGDSDFSDFEYDDVFYEPQSELDITEHFVIAPDQSAVCASNELVSSESPTSHSDSRPITQESDPSVIEMAPANKDKFMRSYRSAVLTWEDTYERKVIDHILSNELDAFIIELATYISGIREVIIHFGENPCDEFTQTELATCNDLRSKAADLKARVEHKRADVRAAESQAAAAATAAANAAALAAANSGANSTNSSTVDVATADVARLTLTAMEPTVMSAADQILLGYKEISKKSVTTTTDYKRVEGACNLVTADCEETVKQLDGLRREAAVAADTDAAQRYVNKISKLMAAKKQAIDSVRVAANTLGLIPGQEDTAAVKIDLKAPKFSGKTGEGLDFFTFSEKLSEYFESLGPFSYQQMFVKLKADCLTEPAISAIKHCLTYQSAFSELKKLYGQPRLMFNNKVKDMKKLGKCPDSLLDSRTWYIDMKNQLNGLWELANKHKLTSMFAACGVVELAEQSMKSRDQFKYSDKLRECGQLDPDFDIEDRTVRVTMMKEFLDECIDKVTFELNLKISQGQKVGESGASDKAKSHDKASDKGSKGKGVYVSQPASQND